MQHQHSHSYQCDICFQPSTPFSFMRVLPVTGIATLDIITHRHVHTSGAIIAIANNPTLTSNSGLTLQVLQVL
jgi:hypothetical protein